MYRAQTSGSTVTIVPKRWLKNGRIPPPSYLQIFRDFVLKRHQPAMSSVRSQSAASSPHVVASAIEAHLQYYREASTTSHMKRAITVGGQFSPYVVASAIEAQAIVC